MPLVLGTRGSVATPRLLSAAKRCSMSTVCGNGSGYLQPGSDRPAACVDGGSHGREPALELSMKLDLILIAPHGRTGSHAFMGNAAEKVIRSANWPARSVCVSKKPKAKRRTR
jgi:hypothetical protein